MLFAHPGFAKKLPSSKQPCSKNTKGLHQEVCLLLTAAWPHRDTHGSLLGAAEVAPGQHGVLQVLGLFALKRAVKFPAGSLRHWGCCDGLCRGATHPPPTSPCEVPSSSAGQLLSFSKFEPLLLLFKLCVSHELHSKRLRTSPPGAPPKPARSSMSWVTNFSRDDGGIANGTEIHLVLHTHFHKATCDTEVVVGGVESFVEGQLYYVPHSVPLFLFQLLSTSKLIYKASQSHTVLPDLWRYLHADLRCLGPIFKTDLCR